MEYANCGDLQKRIQFMKDAGESFQEGEIIKMVA